MSSVVEAAGKFFGAIGSAFDFALQKLRLKNAPAMQANATARTDQEIKDTAAEMVAGGDLEKIRKAASE